MRIFELLAGGALLLAAPAWGQAGQVVPQLGIDAAGSCRKLSVYDATKPGADKMVPIGCVDTATHAFDGGAAVATAAGGSIARPLAARLADVKVADDFGAAGSGAAIQAAIDAAAATRAGVVLVPAGDWLVATTLDLKGGVSLQMSPGAVLKPAANVDVVALRPGASCLCRIDTSGLAGWNRVAIDVDGDNEALARPYRLHTPTRIDAELIGAAGAGSGTAVGLHADGIPNARVMGIDAEVRVSGFEKGYWLRQTSTDLSKFVNANRLHGSFSSTLQSLVMESSHVNGYGLDGNDIRLQHQPRPGTTLPAMMLRGQSNRLDLTPYDWNTVAATAPHAIVVGPGTRTSQIVAWQDPAYVDWQTTDRSNQFAAMNANGGLYLDTVRARAVDGVVRFNAASLRLDNGECIEMRNAAGSTEPCVLTSDSANTTFLRSISNGDLVLDANKAGGVIAVRIQGGNVFYFTATHFAPNATEAQNLGTSSARWGTTYVTSIAHKAYTVASLPGAGGRGGWTAYASDGRKIGEAVGNGTGVLVYSDGISWRRTSDDTTVAY